MDKCVKAMQLYNAYLAYSREENELFTYITHDDFRGHTPETVCYVKVGHYNLNSNFITLLANATDEHPPVENVCKSTTSHKSNFIQT